MSDTYNVVFKYTGKEPSGFKKKLIEGTFVKIYNIYCESVNPHYEEWNSAYDGEKFDDENFEGKYETYILEQEQPYIDKINYAWRKTNSILVPIKEFFIGDDHNFSARLKDGTILEFFLKKA